MCQLIFEHPLTITAKLNEPWRYESGLPVSRNITETLKNEHLGVKYLDDTFLELNMYLLTLIWERFISTFKNDLWKNYGGQSKTIQWPFPNDRALVIPILVSTESYKYYYIKLKNQILIGIWYICTFFI